MSPKQSGIQTPSTMVQNPRVFIRSRYRGGVPFTGDGNPSSQSFWMLNYLLCTESFTMNLSLPLMSPYHLLGGERIALLLHILQAMTLLNFQNVQVQRPIFILPRGPEILIVLSTKDHQVQNIIHLHQELFNKSSIFLRNQLVVMLAHIKAQTIVQTQARAILQITVTTIQLLWPTQMIKGRLSEIILIMIRMRKTILRVLLE